MLETFPQAEGRQFETCCLTLIYFFSPERAQFCSRCLLRFDPAFSGSRLVRCSFSSREGDRDTMHVVAVWGATICGGNLCGEDGEMLTCAYESADSSHCWE